MILLPVNLEQEAAQYIARLRIALTTVETRDGLLTGSFGLALFPQDGEDLWVLMSLADERMYQEKVGNTRRRNAVGTFSTENDAHR